MLIIAPAKNHYAPIQDFETRLHQFCLIPNVCIGRYWRGLRIVVLLLLWWVGDDGSLVLAVAFPLAR